MLIVVCASKIKIAWALAISRLYYFLEKNLKGEVWPLLILQLSLQPMLQLHSSAKMQINKILKPIGFTVDMVGCMSITSSKFRNLLSQFLVSWLKFQLAEEMTEIKSITMLKLLNLLVAVPCWRQIIGKSQKHKKTFPDIFLIGAKLEEHCQLKEWPWPYLINYFVDTILIFSV